MTLDEIKSLLQNLLLEQTAYAQRGICGPEEYKPVGAARAALLTAVEGVVRRALPHGDPSDCSLWCDGCHCLEAIEADRPTHAVRADAAEERALKAERERDEFRMDSARRQDVLNLVDAELGTIVGEGTLAAAKRVQSTLSTLRAERDRLLAERDEANETARRIAASSPRAESDARCKAHGVPWPCEECERDAPAPAIHLPHNPVPSGIVYAPQTATGEYRAPTSPSEDDKETDRSTNPQHKE